MAKTIQRLSANNDLLHNVVDLVPVCIHFQYVGEKVALLQL